MVEKHILLKTVVQLPSFTLLNNNSNNSSADVKVVNYQCYA